MFEYYTLCVFLLKFLHKCNQLFNTPGANANAVKELVILGMLISSRKVTKAIDWCKTIKDEGDNVGKTVEKGKSAFAGPEIKGKTLGVIGLGAIGRLVAEAAVDLGMKVIGYDPYLPADAQLKAGITVNNNLDEIFPVADYITVHVPLTDETREMINNNTINTMKNTVRVLNFARGDLANSADVVEALENGRMAAYVTDFPNAELIGVDGVIAIPHLGASTPESEENCAAMGAKELIDFLENGNIKNSVNMPTVVVAKSGSVRITVIHKNQPNMIATITDTISKDGINIASFEDKNRGEFAYSIIDCDDDVSSAVVADIEAIDGVVKVRVIK
jgi:D-3-phosphoglycerate dehydrogenase